LTLYRFLGARSARGKFFRQGKYLRPSGEDDDDDDDDEEESSEDEEEDDDDDEPPAKAPPSKVAANSTSKSGGTANLSSEDDDDDEDDEEEEEEEEEATTSRKRKKENELTSGKGGGASAKASKRPKVTSFFDEEAEDDDEDDGEDEEPYGTHHDPDDVVRKHYSEEDIRREQMDEDAQELIRQQDRRRAQAGRRFGVDDDHDHDGRSGGPRSVQDLARDIEDRHRMSRRTVDRSMLDRHPPRGGAPRSQPVHNRLHHLDEEEGAVGGPEVFSAVSQQSLVPSVSDPSLWMISCAPGKEQELIYQIMNKCTAMARQGRPLGICGAIAAQSKGKIYIESYSEPAVVEAIQGVRGLLQYTMRLIPIQDMTTVMTVVPKKKPGTSR
jgi:transcription elongation factor SPT5